MGLEEQKFKRSWMYNKNLPRRAGIRKEFVDGVNEFLAFVVSQDMGSEIRCPCYLCANQRFEDLQTIREHLYRRGFTHDYYYWNCHGESRDYDELQVNWMSSNSQVNQNLASSSEHSHLNPEQRMVFDVAGPNFVPYWGEEGQNSHSQEMPAFDNMSIPQDANHYSSNLGNFNVSDEEMSLSAKFWNVLKAADEPLWGECENHTQLSAVSRMLNIKSEFNLSETCYDSVMRLFGECLPRDHQLPNNFYESEKLVKELELPMIKYDLCPKGCMLFWKDDKDKSSCKFCNHPRYKSEEGSSAHKQLHYLPLIPRLQRLYASRATAKHMSWHAEHEPNEGVMSHPSDSEAWKHFNQTYPDFALETRNIRLGLCSDGFAPFSQSGRPYSCWPVIVTPYNLPPSMCLTTPYMFLSMIVPGPSNPKKLIDVCLQPLIDELLTLWHQGVPTYDVSRNEMFCMRASLVQNHSKIWASDEKFQNHSKINTKNRASESPNGSAGFTGGSKSVVRHIKTFLKMNNKEPTMEELITMTYKKKNGEWSGTRPAISIARFKELVAEAEEKGEEVDAVKLWVKAVGVKHGRKVFGLGSSAHDIPSELLEKYSFAKMNKVGLQNDADSHKFREDMENQVSCLKIEVGAIKDQMAEVKTLVQNMAVYQQQVLASFLGHPSQLQFQAMQSQSRYPTTVQGSPMATGDLPTSFTSLLNSNSMLCSLDASTLGPSMVGNFSSN